MEMWGGEFGSWVKIVADDAVFGGVWKDKGCIDGSIDPGFDICRFYWRFHEQQFAIKICFVMSKYGLEKLWRKGHMFLGITKLTCVSII